MRGPPLTMSGYTEEALWHNVFKPLTIAAAPKPTSNLQRKAP